MPAALGPKAARAAAARHRSVAGREASARIPKAAWASGGGADGPRSASIMSARAASQSAATRSPAGGASSGPSTGPTAATTAGPAASTCRASPCAAAIRTADGSDASPTTAASGAVAPGQGLPSLLPSRAGPRISPMKSAALTRTAGSSFPSRAAAARNWTIVCRAMSSACGSEATSPHRNSRIRRRTRSMEGRLRREASCGRAVPVRKALDAASKLPSRRARR